MAWALVNTLILDVDGVLTDGGLCFGGDGEVTKRFHVQDGQALGTWRSAGGTVVVLTGRSGSPLESRMKELSIEHLISGRSDKGAALDEWLGSHPVKQSALACVADDHADLEVMSRSSFKAAVANAIPDVKRNANFVTRRSGGDGAVAEVIRFLLKARR